MVLIDLMKRQLNMLNDLIEETRNRLEKYDNLPEGILTHRARDASGTDYYVKTYKDGTITLDPLGKGNIKTVIAFKRQRYLQEKLKALEADKKATEKYLSKCQDFSPEAICKKLPKLYKGLPINSYEDTGLIKLPTAFGHVPENLYRDPRYQELLRWMLAEYKRNSYQLPDDPNIARDGTPMRSKGECMWYDDALFDGMPCRVDPEIMMKGKSGQWHKLCPDFVFKCFDGTYIYVEHFGKLNDDDYAETCKRKIQEYLDCGIVLGDNLIVTSDNADHHTNELMIIQNLKMIKERMYR